MCTSPLPAAELGMHFSGEVKGLVLPGRTCHEASGHMRAHAEVTLSHTHGTTCAHKQRSGGVRLWQGVANMGFTWVKQASSGYPGRLLASMMLTSLPFLLQLATLPHLRCNTWLSLRRVVALWGLACLCMILPQPHSGLEANSCWVCGGGDSGPPYIMPPP